MADRVAPPRIEVLRTTARWTLGGLLAVADRARLIRLFLQPLLVAWALWSTHGR